jgi:hypothetical protein
VENPKFSSRLFPHFPKFLLSLRATGVFLFLIHVLQMVPYMEIETTSILFLSIATLLDGAELALAGVR